jgi:hypothetical protein
VETTPSCGFTATLRRRAEATLARPKAERAELAQLMQAEIAGDAALATSFMLLTTVAGAPRSAKRCSWPP